MQSISIFLSNICNQYQYFSEIHAINIHISLKSMQSLSIILSNLCNQYQYFSRIYALHIHISLIKHAHIILSCDSFDYNDDDNFLLSWFLLVQCTFFKIAEHKYAEVFPYAFPLYPLPPNNTKLSFVLSCFSTFFLPFYSSPKTSLPHNKCPNQL